MNTSMDHQQESNPEDIVAEAQRRIQARGESAPADIASNMPRHTWAVRANWGVFWLSRHWLALFNVLIGLYTAGALCAPVFMHWGWVDGGKVLHTFYKPFCHQYPFRSWFLFGEQGAYPLHEPISVIAMNQSSRYLGDVDTGYKMALCQRDVAMYGIIVLAGLVYGIVRSRRRVQPLPMWLFFVFGVMPIALDGGIQWLSYLLWTFFPGVFATPFETIPVMRALTGALFGLGLVAVSYPLLDEY